MESKRTPKSNDSMDRVIVAVLLFLLFALMIIIGVTYDPMRIHCYYDDGKRWDNRYSEWVQRREPCYVCDGEVLSIKQFKELKNKINEK